MWILDNVIAVVAVIGIAVALGLVLRRVNYGVRKALFPRVRVSTHRIWLCGQERMHSYFRNYHLPLFVYPWILKKLTLYVFVSSIHS